MLKTLIPNIFYSDIEVGLRLFVKTLGFSVTHEDREAEQPLIVVERDSVKVHLVENAEYAAKDRPLFRIETDDIEAVYNEVVENNKDYLHPNLSEPTLRPWGCTEFAVLDETTVAVVMQEW